MLSDFKKFVLRGNVVDLAVAVVVGAAFAAVVAAFVADFITPLIAAIFGKSAFSGLYFTVNHSKFKYGSFINTLLSFLIVATVVFFAVVIPLTALMRRLNVLPVDEPKPPTRPCPECLSDIPVGARRCAFCTSEVAVSDEAMTSTLPPQGWYPDPNQPGLLRWWDGQTWTAQTQSVDVGSGPGRRRGDGDARRRGADTAGGRFHHPDRPADGAQGGGTGLGRGRGRGRTATGTAPGAWRQPPEHHGDLRRGHVPGAGGDDRVPPDRDHAALRVHPGDIGEGKARPRGLR